MTTSKTIQNKNRVGGDLVGGSKFESHTYYFSDVGPLGQLCADLDQTIAEGAKAGSAETVEKLHHYLKDDDVGGVQGLRNKLEAANRLDDFDDAVRFKEAFTKKLYQNSFSPSAQRVYLHALTSIDRNFKWRVAPKIKAGQERHLIDEEVIEKVLDPVYKQLGPTELDITLDEVEGMLYYLTGNCLIRWD